MSVGAGAGGEAIITGPVLGEGLSPEGEALAAAFERLPHLDGTKRASLFDYYEEVSGTLTAVDQEAVYGILRTSVDQRIAHTAGHPTAFSLFRKLIRHGPKHPEVDGTRTELAGIFYRDLPGFIGGLVGHLYPLESDRRNGDPVAFDQFDLSNALQQAALQYHLARDLWGPLIVNFAHDIRDTYFAGHSPDQQPVLYGMQRDFDLVGVALKRLGVPVTNFYLSRKLFYNKDVLAPDAEIIGDPEAAARNHITLLAQYMRQEGVTSTPYAVFADAGAWGTLASELVLLRSWLSSLSRSGLAQELLTVSPADRMTVAIERMSPAMRRAFEIVTDPSTPSDVPQPARRRMLWEAIISDNSTLGHLTGQQLYTGVLFMYSHHADSRYPQPPNPISSWLHRQSARLANQIVNVTQHEALLEAINDSFEEFYRLINSPAQLAVDGLGGRVLPVLEPRQLVEHVAAHAARLGVSHAATMNERHPGMLPTAPYTIRHMAVMQHAARVEDGFTGVFPTNTPSWPDGEYFLSVAWPAMTTDLGEESTCVRS